MSRSSKMARVTGLSIVTAMLLHVCAFAQSAAANESESNPRRRQFAPVLTVEKNIPRLKDKRLEQTISELADSLVESVRVNRPSDGLGFFFPPKQPQAGVIAEEWIAEITADRRGIIVNIWNKQPNGVKTLVISQPGPKIKDFPRFMNDPEAKRLFTKLILLSLPAHAWVTRNLPSNIKEDDKTSYEMGILTRPLNEDAEWNWRKTDEWHAGQELPEGVTSSWLRIEGDLEELREETVEELRDHCGEIDMRCYFLPKESLRRKDRIILRYGHPLTQNQELLSKTPFVGVLLEWNEGWASGIRLNWEFAPTTRAVQDGMNWKIGWDHITLGYALPLGWLKLKPFWLDVTPRIGIYNLSATMPTLFEAHDDEVEADFQLKMGVSAGVEGGINVAWPLGLARVWGAMDHATLSRLATKNTVTAVKAGLDLSREIKAFRNGTAIHGYVFGFAERLTYTKDQNDYDAIEEVSFTLTFAGLGISLNY